MEQTREQLHAEIRYAQRLCQRTSRLYRRVLTALTFLGVLAASTALLAVSAQLSSNLVLGAAFAFAIFTAANIAIRPADRIAQNDMDVKKYAVLLTKSYEMDVPALQAALAEARQSDVPEIESLRDVAFNDVMLEIGRADALIKLCPSQRLLRVLA